MDDPVRVDPEAQAWVSRGALKLLGALDAFPVSVAGKSCIDIGSSTGGFTEVLLDRGAVSVLAVDVGSGQLHESLRSNSRVLVMEGTNIRHVEASAVGGPFELAVVDLAFISLRLVAEQLAGLVVEGGDALVLIKPQFEVQKADLGKGGILKDAEKRRSAVAAVVDAMRETHLRPQGLIRSPIEGGDGNAEFLLWCRSGAGTRDLEVPT